MTHNSLTLFFLFTICYLTNPILARTIRVPQDSPTIQAGINEAVDGDTVLVAPGVYTGEGNREIKLMGKAVVVLSVAGPYETTIDVEELDSVGFQINQREPAEAVVQGFRIIRAETAIYCNADARIENCILENNRRGLRILNSGSQIRYCIIRNNDNSNDFYGGGGIGISAGYGNEDCTIENCLIVNNKAKGSGGGVYIGRESPTFINCTIAENTAPEGGGIVAGDQANLVLRNCIVWNNRATAYPNLKATSFDISYSNIEGPDPWPGPGNISEAPTFKDPLFHLADRSAGVDAGAPFDNYVEEGAPNGERINMGAYGNTPEAALGFSDKAVIRRLSPDTGPPAGNTVVSIVGKRFGETTGTVTFDGIPAIINSWSDAIISCTAPEHPPGYVTVQVIPAGGTTDSLTSGFRYTGQAQLLVPSSFSTIQSAVNYAGNGDLIKVAPGVYTGTGNREIDLLGKAVTLISEAGPEQTIIDCENEDVAGFRIDKAETSSTIIDGFRIINGQTGIYSEAAPTIKNCRIENHTEAGVVWRANSRDNASGLMENCRISGNMGKGIIVRSSLFGTANPVIENSIIEKNLDGGLYIAAFNIFSFFYHGPSVNNAFSEPVIRNNIIRDNQGFAIECEATGDWYQRVSFRATAAPVITNNLVINNEQSLSAKEAFDGPDGQSWRSFAEPVISNCTFLNNGFLDIISTDSAHVTVHNSIFRDGRPSEIKMENGGTIYSSHSNYDNPQPDLGPGNISTDPKFVDPAGGDFRIFADSPCIDSGDNGYVNSNTDFFGNQRISDGNNDGTATVDMGLFEYALPQVLRQPADQSACVGEQVEFSVEASGDGLSYQWTSNGNPIPGADSARLILPEAKLELQGAYSCVVTDVLGGSVSSSTAFLSVTSLKTLRANISAAQTAICESEEVIFKLETENAGNTPVIRWQVNGQDQNNSGIDFSTTTLEDGDQIRSIVQSSEVCLVNKSDTSNVLQVSVTPLRQLESTITASEPEICAGEQVIFNLEIENAGDTPSITWQINGEDQTTDGLTFQTSTLQNGDEVRSIVQSSEACLTNNPDTSNVLSVRVNPIRQLEALISAPELEVCEGDPVAFQLEVSNAGDNPSIIWQVNGADQTTGGTSFESNRLKDSDQVRSIVQSSEACLINNPDTSNVLSITVHPLPEVELDLLDTVRTSDPSFELMAGLPAGGIYEGAGVEEKYFFDPADAGTGEHMIIYTVTDSFDCTASDTSFIFVEPATSLNTPAEKMAWNVYPNPSTGLFTLSFTGVSGSVELTVLDVRGSIVQHFPPVILSKTGETTTDIDLGYLPDGVYLIRVKQENEVIGKRVAIAK